MLVDDISAKPLQLASQRPVGRRFFRRVHGHRVGLNPDNGTTWIYRGIARGVDIPLELRHDKTNLATHMFGGATWWRPAVLRRGHIYHGFWVYSEPMFAAANQRKIVHYTSTNLKDWSFDSVVPGDRGYDSVVCKIVILSRFATCCPSR